VSSLKPIVLITRPIPESGLKILGSKYTIIMNKSQRPMSRSQLKIKIKNVNGILCFLNDTIDKEIMDIAGENLKIISTFSTGYEHIDVKEASTRGIKVGYTGSILTETTADLAFGLLIAVGRKIVESDKFVRDNNWKYGWSPSLMVGSDIHHKTMGIIGMGKIGKAIATRAFGFKMKVLYSNRTAPSVTYTSYDKKKVSNERPLYVSLNKLVSDSDYIVVCCSLNKDSYHLINYEMLKRMKKSSYIINIARGKIINQLDLIRALKQKLIAGAALDVYEDEPLEKNSPLKKMQNVVILPHIGSASIETRNKMSEIAVNNLKAVLEGKNLKDTFLLN